MNTSLISIIVPVKNGREYIEECLASLTSQTYENVEILIVDGMSTDGTREIVERAMLSNERIHLFSNERMNRGPAMNIGLSHARGEFIARIDVRSRIFATYLSDCMTTLIEMKAENVGGCVYPLWKTETQKAIGSAMSHAFGVGNALFRRGKSGYSETVYLGFYRKSLFSHIGLFDESSPLISEETDINYRIIHAGSFIYCNAAIRVGYYPRETLRGIAQLYHRYGGARALLVLKHGRFSSLRQVVPLLFLCALIFGCIIAVARGTYIPLLTLSLLYVGVACLCAIKLSGFRAPVLAVRIATAFMCMHIPWALGFVRGVVYNGILKRNMNIEA